MSFRSALPQLEDDALFVTDGGLETVLIFHHGLDLPEFAAFPVLGDETGARLMRAYYESFLDIARERDAGFILEAPTWRASSRWGERLGYDADSLAAANRAAIGFMAELRSEHEDAVAPIVISGQIGPQDDAYAPAEAMSADEAQRYHSAQIETLAGTQADMVTALTLTYADEAIGIARAAEAAGIPAAISLTVETDGRLPSGQLLADAIAEVDAETDSAPAYFMVNCAHPTHFLDVLEGDAPQLERIRGVRANASTKSHAELDEAEELDDGDPPDFGSCYGELRRRLPMMNVVGGCCGTDERHVAAAMAALTS